VNSAPPMPARCPSCNGHLHVERLACDGCGTEVQGRYRTCPVCGLDPQARKLLDLFLRARGNLKDVQRALKVSYPTARQRIEEMFQKLELEPADQRPQPMDVLRRVREGELSVDEAERLLRGEQGQ
jgi:hypothetical protein